MKNNRREFIKKSTAMAALSVVGMNTATSEMIHRSVNEDVKSKKSSKSKSYIPDAGVKLCFAYFAGIEAEKGKVEFGRQLNVLGAVGKIDPQMVGLKNVNPWDIESVSSVKNA